jgi:hypothetical protein
MVDKFFEDYQLIMLALDVSNGWKKVVIVYFLNQDYAKERKA